ncbi:MAG: HNH endonuclease [Clostridia bacterium]|nr:HNH endonuclease [Clostridia bacterium]
MIDLKRAKIISVARTNIPDCFVLKNKIGSAHGEAKLYVGGTSSRNWDDFFNNFDIQGIILKSDIMTYLDLAKDEYENQTQGYRNDISGDWLKYYDIASKFDDVISFSITHKDYTNMSRYYINSSSSVYAFLRQICLPVMTTLLLEKIVIDGRHYILFRPYINDIGNIYENEIVDYQVEEIKSSISIDETTKTQIIQARKGQGKYRELILDKFNGQCAVTGVNDSRILIASHIKPWTDSNNEERMSRENGILLSPTFDKLFDKGFISFKNNGQILLSDYFDERNFSRLRIDDRIICKLYLTTEMQTYLDYHRDIVFKH